MRPRNLHRLSVAVITTALLFAVSCGTDSTDDLETEAPPITTTAPLTTSTPPTTIDVQVLEALTVTTTAPPTTSPPTTVPAPTTTHTHPPTTKPAPTPAKASGSVWDRLAQCESGANWSLPHGTYSGGLQFAHSTWTSHGGLQYAVHAHLASRAQQIAVAERVLASSGWGAWPGCASKLGLR